MIKSQNIVNYFLGRIACKESILGKLLRIIPVNDTVRQVLSIGLKGQFVYLDNLWRYNHKRQQASVTNAASIYKIRMAAGLFRRFNQLPCTIESRIERAKLLSDKDKNTCRILALGDDDLLAVELAKQGFKNVTVADCDERLLTRITQETTGLSNQPKFLRADFRSSEVKFEPMDVIFLDPPYSVLGAQTFLSLAVRAAAPTAQIYLMINPHIFGDRFAEITQIVTQAGFKLSHHLPSFNGYPIGVVEEVILRAAWRVMMNLPPPNTTQQSGLLFCSDCFLFERYH